MLCAVRFPRPVVRFEMEGDQEERLAGDGRIFHTAQGYYVRGDLSRSREHGLFYVFAIDVYLNLYSYQCFRMSRDSIYIQRNVMRIDVEVTFRNVSLEKVK